MKQISFTILSLLLLCLLTACSSEWEYADPEAHEKTEQLQQEYNAKLQGSWHREVVNSDHRFFERITFKADQSYTLYRVWKMRQGRNLVFILGASEYQGRTKHISFVK